MPISLKKLLIPAATGVVGAAGGAAIGSAVTKRNLVKAFSNFNQQENNAIAQAFYNQGANDVMGKKAEYVEKIAEAAFIDELEKMAAGGIISPSVVSMAKQMPGKLMSSAKSLYHGIRNAGELAVQSRNNKAGNAYTMTRQAMGQNLRKGLPAAAVMGAGASFVAGRSSKGGQEKKASVMGIVKRTAQAAKGKEEIFVPRKSAIRNAILSGIGAGAVGAGAGYAMGKK